MPYQTILNAVQAQLVHQNLVYEKAITLETRLGEEGLGFDSLGILELLLAIEKDCGVQLRDEGLSNEAVLTFGGLVRYVTGLKGE